MSRTELLLVGLSRAGVSTIELGYHGLGWANLLWAVVDWVACESNGLSRAKVLRHRHRANG